MISASSPGLNYNELHEEDRVSSLG